jgi:5'-methylthioadenosine phosphorylase
MKVAFISGTSIVNSDLFAAWEVKTAETAYGPVRYKSKGDHVLINRHGYGFPLPPHSINYRANIRALADLGYENIVSLNSVGSLKKELPPGTLVSCGDYVGLQQGPATYFDTELKGGTPGIANNLIPLLIEKLAPEFTIPTGKVYVQMKGPRFETKAEVRIVQAWGDVIGMTAAHEADLCGEIGLKYNSFAIIDNYANGLEGSSVDFSVFKELVKSNQEKVNRLFRRMLEILA